MATLSHPFCGGFCLDEDVIDCCGQVLLPSANRASAGGRATRWLLKSRFRVHDLLTDSLRVSFARGYQIAIINVAVSNSLDRR